jgi:hypothetical protein
MHLRQFYSRTRSGAAPCRRATPSAPPAWLWRVAQGFSGRNSGVSICDHLCANAHTATGKLGSLCRECRRGEYRAQTLKLARTQARFPQEPV